MEKDLEIKLTDRNIPELKLIDDISVIKSQVGKLFVDLSQTDNYDDVLQEEYKYTGMLDLFSEVMKEDDPRLDLLIDDYFELSQEKKFLNFFKLVFELNENKCMIYLGENPDKASFVGYMKNMISNLDQIDRCIIYNQIDVFIKSEGSFYMIEDLNLLNTFVKINLRMSGGILLYFDKLPILFEGGFDIHFLVTFEDEKIQEHYQRLASESDLHFL